MKDEILRIIEEMKKSAWYTTAVGADTLQRIRNSSMAPFEGETIGAWAERILTEFEVKVREDERKKWEK